MTTSLLSLPDELLALVVNHALGEYAPRLYQQRQETACALALVNKRVGAVTQPKLVEAVHAFASTPFGFRARLKPEQVPDASRVRALWLDGDGLDWPAHGCLSFAAVRDLRLTDFHGVRLEDLSQLPELRTLLLSQGSFVSDKPLVAPKLERLVLYFCAETRPRHGVEGFTATGCPSLRHLHLGVSDDGGPWPCAPDLIDQVYALGSELMDHGVFGRGYGALVVSDEAALDKVLFDVRADAFETNGWAQPAPHVQHLRLYHDLTAARASDYAELADGLVHFFPSLKTLYLPLEFDASRFSLPLALSGVVHWLILECERARVAVVFEHGFGVAGPGEICAAPHFEARCRRIKAERAAAAAAASAPTNGASAARRG
ncbi:hypothetical protein JCM9279_006598 [Rhodotorula babjevae]